MYPSTEMLISVQKYKLQYGKISPILSTQITAPVKKISISQYKNISSRTSIFIGCATVFFSTVKFMYTTVQQYLSQYKNINLSTKIKVAAKKNLKNAKKNITTVQQCVSQYRNINLSRKKKFRYKFFKKYFSVPKLFFVLKFIFLYWDTHCCIVVIFFMPFFSFFFTATFIFD